jgi:hypothetical protein
VAAANANGSAGEFRYTVSDGQGGSSSQVVALTLTAVNDTPVVDTNKTITLDEDALPMALGFAPATDVDGDPLTITVSAIPDATKGQIRRADGSVVAAGATLSNSELSGLLFAASPNANGSAGAFTYTVTDGNGGTTAQTVTFTLTAVNDAPVAQSDKTITVNEDSPATSLAITAPTDLDGDALTVTVSGVPVATSGSVRRTDGSAVAAGATLTLAELQALTFVPAVNANGAAGSFAYSVADGAGGSASQAITLTILPVNDAPVAPADRTITLDEDTSAALNNAVPTDVDGDALTVTVSAVPSALQGQIRLPNGRVVTTGETLSFAELQSVVFHSAPDANGTAGTFAYTVTDEKGGSATHSVGFSLTPVNDAPVVQNDKTVSVPEDSAATSLGLTAPTDVDGDSLSVSVTAVPDASKGEVRLADGTVLTSGATLTLAQLSGLVFVPAPNFNGAAGAFTYQVADGQGGSVAQTVTLDVISENDAPVLSADRTLTLDEDAAAIPLGISAPADAEGDELLITVDALPTNSQGVIRLANGSAVAVGTVLTENELLALTFTPAGDANGAGGSFSYTVTDENGGSSSQIIVFQINAINDAPVADSDRALTLPASSSALPLNLVAPLDVDGDLLSITVDAVPQFGSIQKANGAIIGVGSVITPEEFSALRYLPSSTTAGDVGFFAYTVSDPSAAADSQRIDLSVERQVITIGRNFTFRDQSGDLVKIVLSGPGTAKATFENGQATGSDLRTIELTGTTTRSALTVTVERGGATDVPFIRADGSLHGVTLKGNISLGLAGAGVLDVGGTLGALKIGGTLSATVDAVSIGAVTAASVQQTTLTVPLGLKSLKTPGAITDVNIDASIGAIGAITALRANGLEVFAGGKVGKLTFVARGDKSLGTLENSTILAGQAVVITDAKTLKSAALAGLKTSGSVHNTDLVSAGSIGAISIGGELTDSHFIAGLQAGADRLILTAGDNYNAHGIITSVKVLGAFRGSTLAAGVDPGADFVWGSLDDLRADAQFESRSLSKIGAVTIGVRSSPLINPFVPAAEFHSSAVISLDLKSIKIGKLIQKDFSKPLFIDADGDGEEETGETLIKEQIA